jgi:adenylylsulfate kinase
MLKKNMTRTSDIVIWFMGLSGSGKSTLAAALENRLSNARFICKVIDGDIFREANAPIGFTRKDRIVSNKRIVDYIISHPIDGIYIVATICPFEVIRKYNRESIANYFQVYLSTPIEICRLRDPKGLYKKALNNEIKHFTGIDQEFEVPVADLTLDTSKRSIQDCLDECIRLINRKYLINI